MKYKSIIITAFVALTMILAAAPAFALDAEESCQHKAYCDEPTYCFLCQKNVDQSEISQIYHVGIVCSDKTKCLACGATGIDPDSIYELTHDYDNGTAEYIDGKNHLVICACGEESVPGMHSVLCTNEEYLCQYCGGKAEEFAESHHEEQHHNKYYHWSTCTDCYMPMMPKLEHYYDCIDDGSECSLCHTPSDKIYIAPEWQGYHAWSDYDILKSATALETGLKKRICYTCQATEEVQIAKLKPTVKLSATKKTIRKGRSYTLSVSSLAKGDYVKSVTRSNKKVSIKKLSSKKYKITSKRKGKVYVTVTLKSGKKAKCLVTVK